MQRFLSKPGFFSQGLVGHWPLQGSLRDQSGRGLSLSANIASGLLPASGNPHPEYGRLTVDKVYIQPGANAHDYSDSDGLQFVKDGGNSLPLENSRIVCGDYYVSGELVEGDYQSVGRAHFIVDLDEDTAENYNKVFVRLKPISPEFAITGTCHSSVDMALDESSFGGIPILPLLPEKTQDDVDPDGFVRFDVTENYYNSIQQIADSALKVFALSISGSGEFYDSHIPEFSEVIDNTEVLPDVVYGDTLSNWTTSTGGPHQYVVDNDPESINIAEYVSNTQALSTRFFTYYSPSPINQLIPYLDENTAAEFKIAIGVSSGSASVKCHIRGTDSSLILESGTGTHTVSTSTPTLLTIPLDKHFGNILLNGEGLVANNIINIQADPGADIRIYGMRLYLSRPTTESAPEFPALEFYSDRPYNSFNRNHMFSRQFGKTGFPCDYQYRYLSCDDRDELNFDFDREFSISAWVLREHGGFGSIVSKSTPTDSGGSAGYELYLSSNNELVFYFGNAYPSADCFQISSEPWEEERYLGRWVHYAVTWKNRSAHLYVNGRRVHSSVTNVSSFDPEGTNPFQMLSLEPPEFYIGNAKRRIYGPDESYEDVDYAFPGLISNARCYRRALNDNELATIYNSESQAEFERYQPRYLDGDTPPTASLTFFMSSYLDLQDSIYLHTQGYEGSFPEFPTFNSSMDLFVNGLDGEGDIAGIVPLFVQAFDVVSDSLDLFLIGDSTDVSASLSLSVIADPVTALELQTNLFVFGSQQEGMTGGISLHTFSDEYPAGDLPLFLKAVTSDVVESTMNLWVQGYEVPVEGGLFPLSFLYFVDNTLSLSGSLELFLQGPEGTDGYYPQESSMNLFLDRNTADAMTLCVFGPGVPDDSSIEMFISGSVPVNDSLSLSVPNVLGYNTIATDLYVHGW